MNAILSVVIIRIISKMYICFAECGLSTVAGWLFLLGIDYACTSNTYFKRQ